MKKLLNTINNINDIKKLNLKQLPRLGDEIRQFLLDNVSKTGGHLASNLGVVELTMAVHYCLDLEKDKIVWDVGHQAYTHKILTGRKNDFKTLRKLHGLSGFPKPAESVTDIFATGHSSTSISAALGIATARDLKGTKEKVVAVIGDGSMTGGLAFEALNNAGRSNTDIVVILNDNQMSISTNVGAVSRHLNDIRLAPIYLSAKAGVHKILDRVPIVGNSIDKAIEKLKNGIKYFLVSGIVFEDLGFNYVGPVDGHNIEELIEIINKIKNTKGPVLLHVKTIKGKGYEFAEKYPCKFHGIGCFDIETGECAKNTSLPSFSNVFGESLVSLAKKDKRILGISAAMASGTGLEKFEKIFPNRFFDVGIAEQHAVTFAAGLASQGYIPVFAVYSTFLQRAYDQIIEDVCLQNLHVIFAIDRAGIVGADGETHQGVFDISFLSHIPNILIMAPRNGKELKNMLSLAVELKCPVAIRYPRENAEKDWDNDEKLQLGISEIINHGKEIAIISCGTMFEEAKAAWQKLKDDGKTPMLINARFIKPLDSNMIKTVCENCQYVFTIEDNLLKGGFGSIVTDEIIKGRYENIKITNLAFDDKFIEQGSRQELFQIHGLDGEGIYKSIKKVIDER